MPSTSHSTVVAYFALSATAGTVARGISVDPVQGVPKVEVHASVVEALGVSNVALRASIGDIDAATTQLAASNTAVEADGGSIRCFGTYTGSMAAATC